MIPWGEVLNCFAYSNTYFIVVCTLHSSVWNFANGFTKRPLRRCSFLIWYFLYVSNPWKITIKPFLMLCILIMCLAARNNTWYYWKDKHYHSTYMRRAPHLLLMSRFGKFLEAPFASSEVLCSFKYSLVFPFFYLIKYLYSLFLLMKRKNWYLLIYIDL